MWTGSLVEDSVHCMAQADAGCCKDLLSMLRAIHGHLHQSCPRWAGQQSAKHLHSARYNMVEHTSGSAEDCNAGGMRTVVRSAGCWMRAIGLAG